MNILASYNWIKEYLDTDQSPQEFADDMSAKSMSIEHIDHLAERFNGMVIGVVKELKAHPDADKLRIAVTDIGERTINIVCGGTNLTEGQRVLVALPGARVRWHGEGDLVELKETKIRGVASHGMICAPAEVGFPKAPCGETEIWDLTDLLDSSAGTSFADAFDLNDVLMDIEVTTNRPDSMSIIGLAREAGVATPGTFTFEPSTVPAAGSGKELSVTVEEPDLCPRYMAVVIDGVKVGPSPAWLQNKILLSGHRPINNIVDITNLILHEYGQPLHTFDYDKIEGGQIIVRKAKDGETFMALDENEYKLSDSHLVVADASKASAVAGVMGGMDSGTTQSTTTIVLEAATFDALSTRRTSRALNLYSDSQSLFEKGLSTESPEAALARAVELVLELAGGQVASEVFDIRKESYSPKKFAFNPQAIRDRIGVDISDEDQKEILEKLGFVIDGNMATVPYYRDHDIEDAVDLSEEVARMYGYAAIPSRLPDGEIPHQAEDKHLHFEGWLKHELRAAGYTEFFSYSFTNEAEMAKYDIDPSEAMKIHNPLSSDLTHMRTSLIPSMLTSIAENERHTRTGRVFELSRVYEPVSGDLPKEESHLVVAEFGVQDGQAAFQSMKGLLEYIGSKTGLELTLERLDQDPYWHPYRTAAVFLNDVRIGVIGQVAQSYQDAFDIERPVMLLQLDLEKAIPHMKHVQSYTPAPEFPSVERDLALLVDQKVEFDALADIAMKQSPLVEHVDLVEIYVGKGIPDGKKSVTIRIRLRAADRTLSSDMVDEVMDVVGKAAQSEVKAEIR